MKYIGARVQRMEDKALLTGGGQFTDDIRLPGTLAAAFVRSPVAHGRIRGIDTAAAAALPGVHAVYTAADMTDAMREPMPMLVPNPAITHVKTQHCLARETVHYVGQAIAVVIAVDRYVAEDALALVDLDIETLTPVADCRAAQLLGAAVAHQDLSTNTAAKLQLKYGDASQAFAKAAHVFEEHLWQHRGGGQALEGRAVIARYDRTEGRLTLWSATQAPHLTKQNLADLLELAPNRLRVIAPPDVGGGFGPKALFYGEEAVLAVSAMRLGHPVKWTEDRYEHFLTSTQERDQYWDVAVAMDADGRILGFRGKLLHDTGAYLPWGVIMPYIAATTTPGPYVIPNFSMDVSVVFTNKVPTTPVRGAGRPQAVFAMERLMDRAAIELGIDRAEIRRRNLIRAEQMPYAVGLVYRDGKPVIYDSGDYVACQAKAVALSGWEDFPARQAEALRQGRHIGIGIGNYVEGTGLGPFEGATVRIMQSGKVVIETGAAPQGQGHKTTLAQICAEHLGVPIEDVTVVTGDTAAIAMGVGTFASRITANAGSSTRIAAIAVRDKAIKLAAHMLEAAEQDLEIADGAVRVKGVREMSVTLSRLARMAQGVPGFSLPQSMTPGLEHTEYFSPAQATYCNGTHIAEVEVDTGTGAVRVLRYIVAHDSGTLINPLIVDGQIQGGVAHGIGNALLEWMGYDENAQPTTVTFADYLLPTATDVPAVEMIHQQTPTPLNPLGAKGAGEGGTIPAAAAIISAVENALSPFAVHIAEAPIFPERITQLLDAARAAKA